MERLCLEASILEQQCGETLTVKWGIVFPSRVHGSSVVFDCDPMKSARLLCLWNFPDEIT